MINMIRIFALNASQQDFGEARWQPYLSVKRKEEAKRRRLGNVRQLYLGAEALLNLSLERMGAGIPLPAAYERDSYGKPYLTPECGIYVNWSHSGDYALCAVADCEVGIDIQAASKEPKEALVRKVLQPEEREYYERTPEALRRGLFYRYWAVKESFLKARGTGLSQGFRSFWVDMSGVEGCPAIVQRAEGRDFYCRLLDFYGTEYAAAACWEKDAAETGIEIEELS